MLNPRDGVAELLAGFRRWLVEANLGPRTVDEYVAIVKRSMRHPDMLDYVKSDGGAS